jgi:hypothetical protein
MALPPIIRLYRVGRRWISGAARRGKSVNIAMDPIPIVVDSEITELSRQVGCVPEECAVKQLAANRANQALNEWMGNGRKGYRLDLLDSPNTQIRQPAVKTEQ